MEDIHSDHGTVVKPDEAALIVDKQGEVTMCMPEYGDEDEVPYPVMLLTAVWLKMREDDDWAQQLVEEVFDKD